MDGISDEFSRHPLSIDSVTGGTDWGQWFDRLVGTWAQYRIIKSNDVTRNEGKPQAAHPAQVSVSGSVDAVTLIMLGGAALLVWLTLKK